MNLLAIQAPERLFRDVFHETLAGGVGLVVLLVLMTLQLILLPRPQRRTVFVPLACLVLHLAVLGLRGLFVRDDTPWDVAGALAFFLLLVGIGRSAFVLVFKYFFPRLYKPLPKIFLDIIQTFLYGTALLITLGLAGVQPLSLLTGSAVLTAIIGFSLKDTLGNLFSGLAIQMEEPFEVGDWIQFDAQQSHIGRVVEINWRATKVVTLDEVEIVIPNATLGQGFITNFTRPKRFSRRSVYVHAPYDVPTQHAQRILRDATAAAWGVLAEPPPSVVTNAFDERGVQYWVRFFTNEFDKRDRVDGGVRDRIWYALHRAGITIPPPLHSVAVTQHAPEPEQERQAESLAEREHALRGVDIFEPLSPEALTRLAGLAESRLYAAEEIVIRQGDPGDELFVIQQGRVSVRRDAGGDELTVTHLGPGSFFGEMSLMTGATRSATIQAVEECRFLVVGKPAFRQILEGSPDLADRISQTMAERQANQVRLEGLQRDQAGQEKATASRSHQLLRLIQEFFAH
jgi:small-conductance mechanosensitive channel/CRP-like cAMP-binding protein